MNNLQWTTVQKKVTELIPQQKNPRKISKKQMQDLKNSLEKFNLVEIPVIDTDNTVLAGHQRLTALQLLGRGDELIDVRVPNRKLEQDEIDRYLIASNALGGTWDFEKLKIFEADFLVDIGFDPIELSNVWDKVLNITGDTFDEQAELSRFGEPVTQLGDIIIMGRHKLICGDSTNPDTLKRLFGEERSSMIYSDPVYNIRVDYNRGIGGKQSYGGSVKDSRSEEAYRELIKKSMECALSVSKKDLHVFYWSDQKYIWLMQTLYQELGIENKRVCLWIKNGLNPTPKSAFNKCYEPCTYGTKGSPFLTKKEDVTEILNKDARNGNGLFDDIWTIKRMVKYEHATSKPIDLHEKAILRCTRPGDIILDSFAGSGSTLMAAEQLNRRVYCVELEPRFCDLIRRRWEEYTNLTAQVIKSHEAC